MKESVLERINHLIDDSGESKNALAVKCDMAPQTFGRYVNGDNKITVSLISSLLEVFPDLSAEWLLRGKGSMYITELPHVEMQDGDDKTEELTVELAKITRKYNEAVLELEELKAEYNKVLAQLDWASGIIKESLRKESAQKVG